MAAPRRVAGAWLALLGLRDLPAQQEPPDQPGRPDCRDAGRARRAADDGWRYERVHPDRYSRGARDYLKADAMSAVNPNLQPLQFKPSAKDVRYDGSLVNHYGVSRGNLDTWYHGGPSAELTNHDPKQGEHWNIGLGTHFAENPKLAEGFATGETGKEKGTVVAAHLQSTAPKVYKSEYDMDADAYHNERHVARTSVTGMTRQTARAPSTWRHCPTIQPS
jgi:hypothetical protein